MEQYERIKVLGEGSYGKVYLMRHKRERKLMCVKVIKIKNIPKKEREACRTEVDLLKRLNHPNIVSYRESFLSPRKESLCIAMEYCDGGDLCAVIKGAKRKLFPESKILHYFVQMALGLHYMHSKRVLHRDLKTQNIFLLGNGRLVLGDLGISKVLDGTIDFAKTCIGTPYYMSPEIFKNQPYNLKSDIWALGCVLYELTTLNHAFDASSLNGLALKIIKGRYPPIHTKYTRNLRDLIARMLSTAPEQRPDLQDILTSPFIKRHIQNFIADIASREQRSIGQGTMVVKAAAINFIVEAQGGGASEMMSSSSDANMTGLQEQLAELGLQSVVAKALTPAPTELPPNERSAIKVVRQQASALRREEDRKKAVESALARLRREREERLKQRQRAIDVAKSNRNGVGARRAGAVPQMRALLRPASGRSESSQDSSIQEPSLGVVATPALPRPPNTRLRRPSSQQQSAADGSSADVVSTPSPPPFVPEEESRASVLRREKENIERRKRIAQAEQLKKDKEDLDRKMSAQNKLWEARRRREEQPSVGEKETPASVGREDPATPPPAYQPRKRDSDERIRAVIRPPMDEQEVKAALRAAVAGDGSRFSPQKCPTPGASTPESSRKSPGSEDEDWAEEEDEEGADEGDQVIASRQKELEDELQMSTLRCNELRQNLQDTKRRLPQVLEVREARMNTAVPKSAAPNCNDDEDEDEEEDEEDSLEISQGADDSKAPPLPSDTAVMAYYSSPKLLSEAKGVDPPQNTYGAKARGLSSADRQQRRPRERSSFPSANPQSHPAAALSLGQGSSAPKGLASRSPVPTGRLADRIRVLRQRCIDGLGEQRFQKAYDYLRFHDGQDDDDAVVAGIANILGPRKVHYHALIDQLKFIEESHCY